MIGYLLRASETELEAFLKNSSLLENKIYADEVEGLLDIDKTWDGIIFLLTGKGLNDSYDHPMARVLFSGQLIDDDQDLGYGPAHYLRPAEVKEINAKIASINRDELRKSFLPQKMTELEVYPTIWDEGEDTFDYLADNFKNIQDFYALAARNGEAVITYLS